MFSLPRSHQLRPRAAHGTCAHGLRLHRVCDNRSWRSQSITAAMAITAVCTAQNITFVPHCRRHGIVAHTRSVAHSARYKQLLAILAAQARFPPCDQTGSWSLLHISGI